MRNSTKVLFKKICVLLTTVMILSFSACSKDEPAVTEETGATETETSVETTAETSVETTAQIVVEMAENQVYDGTYDLIAVPDNPGCDYPAVDNEVGTTGAGRLSVAGEPFVFYKDGKKLGIGNRVNRWDSIDVTLGDLEAGNYTLEVKFSADVPHVFTIEYADSPWSALASSEESLEATLTFDFTLDEKGIWNAPVGVQNRIRLNSTPLQTYYIDSIKIFDNGGEVVAYEKIVTAADLSLPSLAETYKNNFLVGNIIETHQLTDESITDMFKHHYNVATLENSMKPEQMSPAKSKYNFDGPDKTIAWAEQNNIKVHGHTLVWHAQNAKWLTNDENGNALTRAEAKANLEEYINEVAGHYKGKLLSWDVVNEAFQPSVSSVPADWRDALRKGDGGNEGSPWYAAYENGAADGESGADYIYDAFVFTRLADPSVTLYFIDFNETEEGKYTAIAMMIEELNEQWKNDSRNTEPNRLLIEGMGMQAHYWTDNLNPSDVDAAIQRFNKTGVRISISELDIPIGNYSKYGEPTEEEQLKQVNLYKQLFEIFKKNSDNIERVTFWGKSDSQSWRSEGYPLLFDETFAAKEAYYAVIEVAKE